MIDPDKPDARVVAELVARYQATAQKLRNQIIRPVGSSDDARAWNQARASQILAQVDREIAALKQQAAKWTGSALSGAVKRGAAVADKQARQAGITPDSPAVKGKGSPLRGSFAVVDRKAVELLAKDTVRDLYKAADSMQRHAGTTLRRMAATGVTNAQVNAILTGGIIEGKPVEAIRELREALKVVHGDKVLIKDKNGQDMAFEVGRYAKMVAVTKSRETTVKARHAKLQEKGIDLVVITGKQSNNFCTAYMDKVFSISGDHPKYPPLTSLPGGGPPFHPNCSKGTAPFIEELADPEEITAGQPDADTQAFLGTNNRNELQKRFESLQMRQVVRERTATLRTDAGPKAIISATDDVKYQKHLLEEWGVKSVRLGGNSDVGAHVVRGIQQVVSAGGTVPREIVVTENLFLDASGKVNPKKIGLFNYRTQTMTLNPGWPGWKDAGEMKEAHRRRLFSSANPLHPVFHEASHAHMKTLGVDHRNAPLPNSDRRVAEKVSLYAATNKDEFLAEFRAARMAGRRFTQDAMDLYERLGGQ